MPLLEIVQVGDPVLRAVARAVTQEELARPELLSLIDDMRETMRAAPGVGLAAPQIGIGLKLAVIEDPASVSAEDRASREREPVPFHVIVNPTLTVEESEPARFYEGCLSLSGFAAEVARA
ncbi:MAG: peptide deformylase, partial [Polyangia bacterium]